MLPSLFLNYDLNLQSSTGSGGPGFQNDLGALLELGASRSWGVFTTTVVGRELTDGARSDWSRLESTFTRHLPERSLTLRVGDAATRAGLWGSSVYFGGIQIGSNYALAPGLLTQPLPLVGGVSAAPSTVQLYVNDVLRRVSQVTAGPFVIDNLSGLSGGGEAKLVVRDILGREVVYVQRFFTSGQLLRPGLSDWSVELGAMRENLGIQSNSYGPGFTSGTWRRGITDLLTLEGRAELSRVSRTVGVGAIAGLPYDVLARAALARSSHERVGSGTRWLLGLDREWVASALYLQVQGTTRRYSEFGRPPQPLATRLEWAANYTTDLPRHWGRLGLSLVGVDRFDSDHVTTVSVNYTAPLPRKGALTVTVSRAVGAAANGGTLVGASVTLPLDSQLQTQTSATHRGGITDVYTSVSQSAVRDGDFGWRALAGRIQNEAHAEAGVYYGGRYGRVFSDVSASPSQTSWRSGLTGGVVYAAGRPFLTQRVDQSFAVVEVKGLRDVGVGLGSTVTARTDENGIALVPFLSPYQQNQVRLNATDLPISAEIASIEQLVVPVWRSGVKVDFPVRGGRAALVKLVLDDGEPAPAGGIVRIEGDAEEFYVARRGEAYVTGVELDSRLRLHWRGQSCEFRLALPPAGPDEIARVGPIRCAGVKR